MSAMRMNLLVRTAFQDCQDSYSTHPKLVKKLRKFYDNYEDKDDFMKKFITYLRVPLSGVHERSQYIERILEFVAKFACSFLNEDKEGAKDDEKSPSKATEKDKSPAKNGESPDKNGVSPAKSADSSANESLEDDEEEQEMPFYLHRLFDWLLDNHNVEGVDARLHICQLLNKLLKYMGVEACIADDLYNKIYYGMLERLKDRVADIRSQAVTALMRLQDPKDENCPIIKAYLFHLAHDPNSVVRRTIVKCIGATRLTLPHILERTQDVDEGVRRASYRFLAEKVHIKSLTIGQREGVLQRGLKERSETSRKVVEKELIPSWLRLSNHNIIQFLHHLDVGNSEQNFKVNQQMSAPSGALEVIFKDLPFNELVSNFQYLDERKLIPVEKLTPETALYWRVLIQFLSKETTDDFVDKLRPELSPFCDYVRSFVLSATSIEDDDLNWEFIAKELIIISSFYDLGDEVGRRNLVKLVKDLLISDRTTPLLIPQLMHIFTKVEKNAQSRIEQIAEVIAELKDPMTVEPDKVLEAEPMDVTEVVDQKLIRSLNLEIAKLRVDMTSNQESLDQAIAEQDFVKAQEIKVKILELEAKRAALEEEIKTEQNKATVNRPPAAQAPELIGSANTVSETVEDPAVTLKCLKLLVATLQDPKITSLNATLHTLLGEMVVVAVQSEIASIRKEAILALGCFCLRSPEDARTHMLLLLQATHIDVSEVRIAAISTVIDLLMRHGLSAFITSNGGAVGSGDASNYSLGLDRPNLSGTEGELSETGSSIETALDSDMATRGAALSQAELNAQGGNSVVVILSKMLDEPDLELRTEVAEGLCKLLMIGAISSPKLLSRLLLMWYNPMTESNSKLRHILGTFFPLYASMSKAHQMAIECAFIPTMKVLFDAPHTSPLADIDTEDVGMFLVHLCREDMLQSYQPSRPAVEGEITVSSVHDTLAFTVCNEILSAPDSFQTKVLVKLLSNLQITSNNYVSLRELNVLSEQLLTHVREKLCRKSLEKFARNISEWLARDPSKLAAAEKRPSSVAEMRPLDETVACTPGKKKRFLFSQSTMNNSLLDPDGIESTRIEEENLSIHGTPRRIPSPVCSRDTSKSKLQENIESTIQQTKDLDINGDAFEDESADGNSTLTEQPDKDKQVESMDEDSSDEIQPTPPVINGVDDGDEDRLKSISSVDVVPNTPESSTDPSSQESADVVPDTPSPVQPTRGRRSLRTSASSKDSFSSSNASSQEPRVNGIVRTSDLESPAGSRRGSRRSSPAPALLQKQKSAKEASIPARNARNASPASANARNASPAKARHTSPKRQQRSLEVPSSPGMSRAGRKNSPRIDYRTGKTVVSADKENSPEEDPQLSTSPSKNTNKQLPSSLRKNNQQRLTASPTKNGTGPVASLKKSNKQLAPSPRQSSQELAPSPRQTRRSQSPFVNGNSETGKKGSQEQERESSRKRVHPPPSQESRNSSPILRTKTARSKTPAANGSVKNTAAKSAVGSQSVAAKASASVAAEMRRSSRKGVGGSDSDSSVGSPNLRKSKRAAN